MYPLLLLLLIAPTCSAIAASPTRIESSEPLHSTYPVLGTMSYPPTAAEKEAAKGWTEAEMKSGSPEIDTLRGAVGRRVCWFGIVREVQEDKARDNTVLVVEMKYFDGLTDLHLQVVSICGAGDLRAFLRGTGHKIKRLSLARIYGKVTKEDGTVPTVAADYVRLWDWGLFTFMDYGKDKSNPKWVAARQIKSENAYSSAPDREYYEKLLGKR
jgi:hypothetical protein